MWTKKKSYATKTVLLWLLSVGNIPLKGQETALSSLSWRIKGSTEYFTHIFLSKTLYKHFENCFFFPSEVFCHINKLMKCANWLEIWKHTQIWWLNYRASFYKTSASATKIGVLRKHPKQLYRVDWGWMNYRLPVAVHDSIF